MSYIPSSHQHDLSRSKLYLDTEQSVRPKIALLNSMDLIDDYLDHINISLETFCHDFTGNWMFGFAKALSIVGVDTTLFYVSTRVSEPTYLIHQKTQIPMCILPASSSYRLYRFVRAKLLKQYGAEAGQSFKQVWAEKGQPSQPDSLIVRLKDGIKSLGTYLATPLPQFAKELKQQGCRALMCQEYESPRFDTCVLLGQLTGIRSFATFQGGDKTQSSIERWSRQWAFDRCTGVLVSPQKEIDRIRQCYDVAPDKVSRIFTPIDTAIWHAVPQMAARTALGLPQDARMVVCHGRIDMHRKGLDILLLAWEQLCRDRPNADLRLVLVGTGPDSAKMRQWISDRQLRGIIWRDEFVNDQPTIRQYLSAADVYVMASRQEGFPIAPLEAMACGLPIVAADAPGVPDILEQGEASGGVMVARESVDELAIALGRILDDPVLGIQLGTQARQRIEQSFSPLAIGRQLRSVLLGEPLAPLPSAEERSPMPHMPHNV
ncbi:glycosyltransferase family 4 protein [Leptolyngbya sp. AN02str]|uniref:glycosyltransferase family 4 protein n=1 Tax=Leptolyngbya sp. AN02str TaxID=3423363 RepID=UPI003D31872A